jgi:hypothetical protein
MAVRFAASSLRVTFLSRPGNRNAGFNITYLADGTCFRACGGAACVEGLCQCPPGRAGACTRARGARTPLSRKHTH